VEKRARGRKATSRKRKKRKEDERKEYDYVLQSLIRLRLKQEKIWGILEEEI